MCASCCHRTTSEKFYSYPPTGVDWSHDITYTTFDTTPFQPDEHTGFNALLSLPPFLLTRSIFSSMDQFAVANAPRHVTPRPLGCSRSSSLR